MAMRTTPSSFMMVTAACSSRHHSTVAKEGGGGSEVVVELKQGSVTEGATPATQGFYDNVVFEAPGRLPQLQPEGMAVDLLPFQKEGVAWMVQREAEYTGGVMADHLGMGKTVQMIGLCVAMAHPTRLKALKPKEEDSTTHEQDGKPVEGTEKAPSDKKRGSGKKGSGNSVVPRARQLDVAPINTKPLGFRLITVIRQMQKIPAVGNCSRITRPGTDLFELLRSLEDKVKKFTSKYDDIEKELRPWLDFCQRYNPGFAARAREFLKDKKAVRFDDADTPELRTLIIVPASLILQWKAEIEKKAHKDLKVSVHIYHGQNRTHSASELECFDFVITSYETVAVGVNEHFHSVMGESAEIYAGRRGIARQSKFKNIAENAYFDREKAGPLFQVKWKRIIMDEAHMIRHGSTRRWRAVNELRSDKKWVVTATPLHNTIEDLQNLLTFINTPKLPFMHSQNPEQMLQDPVLQRSISRALQPVFLRRGPVMIRNGKNEVLVKLPEKQESIRMCELSDEETMIYNDILLRSQQQIQSMHGDKKALHLFAMMTRLRQTCCHHWLAAGKAVEIYQCGICKGEAHQAIVTKCGHAFCHECLMSKFREEGHEDEDMRAAAEAEAQGVSEEETSKPRKKKQQEPHEADNDIHLRVRIPCPVCRFSLPFSVFKKHHLTSRAHMELLKKKEWSSSSKLDAIVERVDEIIAKFPEDKIVIFSHFTSFLDIISVAFDRVHRRYQRLDGTMSLRERNLVIEQFARDEKLKVLLASKMAIGVGLNLTMANHVIVVDPWWNPAIEEQAVHRCHRIGQKKDVTIERFIVAHTIEQYCHEVCQRKKDFSDAVLKAATDSQQSEAEKVKNLSRLNAVVGKLHAIDRKSNASSPKLQIVPGRSASKQEEARV